ncbi:CAP domain-containing protein [Chytriomyces sp. MP71]|nr:CAP domain-containing protein [Chytriomyces sp. MP71]
MKFQVLIASATLIFGSAGVLAAPVSKCRPRIAPSPASLVPLDVLSAAPSTYETPLPVQNVPSVDSTSKTQQAVPNASVIDTTNSESTPVDLTAAQVNDSTVDPTTQVTTTQPPVDQVTDSAAQAPADPAPAPAPEATNDPAPAPAPQDPVDPNQETSGQGIQVQLGIQAGAQSGAQQGIQAGVSITATAQASGVVDCTQLYLGFQETGNQQLDLLNMHNAVRANVNRMLNRPNMQIGPLSWSNELAGIAQTLGQQNRSSVCANTHLGGPGQNYDRFSWTPKVGDWIKATGDWTGGSLDAPGVNSECANYAKRFEIGGFDNIDAWGHYTQVVWPTTTQVGCVSVDCTGFGVGSLVGGQNIVCEYEPRGNVIYNGAGDFMYTF